jgi:hypothetical protein
MYALACMAGVWHVFQACGWMSWLCLLAGMLTSVFSVIAVVVAIARGRVSVLLAWAALAIALVPGGLGVVGMALGRAKVEQAITGEAIEPEMRSRIRQEGYREAGGCVEVGGALTVPPLLLAAIALGVAYALRRKVPG